MTNAALTDCAAGMPPRRGYVQTSATRISYLEWGEQGRPLMLLHGITSSARSWWRVAPALAARGYHVYAPDMPGHGESTESAKHQIDHIGRLVAATLSALDLTGVVLIGTSWGGATALALASATAGRWALARVVLIDPLLRLMTAWADEGLPRYLEGVGLPPDQTLPAVRAANPDWHECDVFWKGEALQQCRAAAVRGLFTESGDWDLTARLAQVDIPLLLLVADPQYTIISPEMLAQAERALRPGLGQLRTIPGTNHNMLRGGFDVVMPIVTEWLDQSGS